MAARGRPLRRRPLRILAISDIKAPSEVDVILCKVVPVCDFIPVDILKGVVGNRGG